MLKLNKISQIFAALLLVGMIPMVSSAETAVDCSDQGYINSMTKDDIAAEVEGWGLTCLGQFDSADKACSSSEGGMDMSQLSGLMQQANGGEQQPGPAGIAEACATQANMHKMSMMVTSMVQMSCSSAVGSCTSTCEAEINEVSSMINGYVNSDGQGMTKDQFCKLRRFRTLAKSEGKKCSNDLGAKSGQAMGQMMMSMIQAKMAERCAMEAGMKAAELAAFCKNVRNFHSPACANVAVDCMSADNARTHPKCICANPAMAASHPACSANGLTGQNPQDLASFSSTQGVDGRGSGLLSDAELRAALQGNKRFNGREVDPTQNEIAENQKERPGGGGPSSGSSGSLGRGRQGRYVGPYKTDILQGTVSNKGGLTFGSRGAKAGAFKFGNGDKKDKKKNGLDLKKFMPKVNPLGGNRGLAGAGVKDGVTGAMGPSIWEKVSRRYKKVQPFLEP